MSSSPGTFRVADGSRIEMADAKAAWTPLARDALIRVARGCHGLVNYGELAEELQERSGIRTRQLIHYWIGDVLGAVARDCHARGGPLLSALCVQQIGHIGDGYGWALRETYGEPIHEDLDVASADERLRCYQHLGAPLAADDGRPALTPAVAAERKRAAARARQEARPLICPTCHLALPLTGQCDNCT